MAPTRFGLIACSSVARRRFLPALAAVGPQVACLTHIGSRDPAKAAGFAREFPAARCGSYEGVLADPAVDAVYISTPPLMHAEWVERAARSGKHVWCEKPAFSSLETAEHMVELCRTAGVRLIEGFVFGCHPQHARFAEVVSSGGIGTPRQFGAEFTYPMPPAGDIRLNPGLAGGVLHDSAGYLVAGAIRQMPAPIVEVDCKLHVNPDTGVDDSLCLWMRFEDGAMGFGHAGMGLHYRSRYWIVGTTGRLELTRAFAVQPEQTVEMLHETREGTKSIQVPAADQWAQMIREVSLAVQRPLESVDFEGRLLKQHRIMEAVHRSASLKRSVQLNEIS